MCGVPPPCKGGALGVERRCVLGVLLMLMLLLACCWALGVLLRCNVVLLRLWSRPLRLCALLSLLRVPALALALG